MLTKFTVLIIPFLFIRCNTNVKESPIPLWESTGYFEKEIHYLEEKNMRIKKQLILNNKEDIVNITNVSWRSELSIFTLIDLNNPKNIGMYTMDTLLQNDTIFTISYRAKNVKTPLQECTISTNIKTKKTILFEAKYVEVTNLNDVRKKLTYYPTYGYSIEESQQVKFGNRSSYSINATFINN